MLSLKTACIWVSLISLIPRCCKCRSERTINEVTQPQFAQKSLLMTEGSKSLEQRKQILIRKRTMPSGNKAVETTKTAKQQVKQKGRSEIPSVLHHNEEASSPVKWIRLQDYCPRTWEQHSFLQKTQTCRSHSFHNEQQHQDNPTKGSSQIISLPPDSDVGPTNIHRLRPPRTNFVQEDLSPAPQWLGLDPAMQNQSVHSSRSTVSACILMKNARYRQ